MKHFYFFHSEAKKRASLTAVMGEEKGDDGGCGEDGSDGKGCTVAEVAKVAEAEITEMTKMIGASVEITQ